MAQDGSIEHHHQQPKHHCTMIFPLNNLICTRKQRRFWFLFLEAIIFMEMAARWTWEEREQIVDVIGCGAIKYNDLKNDHSADYMLSLYDILSNQGDTGVSLQFALACARSVISKSGVPMNELKMAQDVTIELDAGRKNTEGRLLGLQLIKFAELRLFKIL